MASWISQTLHLPGPVDVELLDEMVRIGLDKHWTEFYPANRDEANQFSVALRLAAKRIEEIGKGLPNE